MLTLPEGLKTFLESEEVCTLAVTMGEGGVHVAPLLFWCDTETLKVYMCTSKLSEKMWWVREGKNSVSAAVAIGLSKQLPYSLQMRGKLEQFDPSSDPKAASEYRKIASDLDNPDDPENTMIVFTPTWARYTNRGSDYTRYRIDL